MLGYLVQLFFEDNFEDEDNYNRYSINNNNNQFNGINQIKVSIFHYFFIFTFIFFIVDLIILYHQHRENIKLREIDLSLKLNKIINDFENNNINNNSVNSNKNNNISNNLNNSNGLNSNNLNKRSTVNLSTPSPSKSPINLIKRSSVPDLNSINKQQEDLLINQAKNEIIIIKESKDQIEKAKILDQSLDYKNSVKLYIEAIEKLMSVYSSYKDSKDFKSYIDFYLKRAEYLKSELNKNTNIKSIINFDNFQKQNQQQQILEQQNQQTKQQPKLFSSLFPSKSTINIPTSTLNKNLNLNSNNKILNKNLSSTSLPTSSTSLPTSSTSITNKKLINNLSQFKLNSNNLNVNNIPEIKGVDKSMITIIMNEILDRKSPVTWNDVVGLDKVKQSLMESVILPNLRPDVFTGLRAPPRGLLLFGPPGTGKSMIAKAVAYESKVTFFSISASSLTSKYVGDGEKLARALFAVATHFQPSIIFIDEIDSLLTERSSNESEASRRLKTEILLQFDGVRTNGNERVLVMGATNRPEDLDDAALRRLVKRIYVGLPEFETRLQIIQHLLKDQRHTISDSQLSELANLTNGYSGFDLTSLCKDAAYEPIRRLGSDIKDLDLNEISSISFKDFRSSLKHIRPSVSSQSLKSYEKWNSKYGLI